MRKALQTLFLLLFVSALTCPSSYADTGFDALDNSALPIKSPSNTPLITIRRVGQRLIATGTHGVIIVSADDGATWKQSSVPVDLDLTDLYFSSQKKGWAVGHYGTILQTDDAGSTWAKSINGLNVIRALNEVAKLSQTGAISNPASQLKLRVATAFQRAGPNKPFLAIGQCGPGILAAGQQDMAMFSSDGGKSWQEWTSQINNPKFQNIYQVLSDGASTILVGEGGLLLESDAGCGNFRAVMGPYTATLFGGVIVNPGVFFVYGLDGGLFKTNDAGKTWQTIVMPPGTVIDTGLLLNSGQVLLGTLDGTVYISDKAAENFRQLPMTEPFQISGMAIAPNGNVVTVGNGGVGIIPAKLVR